ncbi:MAG: sterol desaturase family protein [Alphaproteobacteria bacterium]|nr:sterol desaturase family protein [Alphaproteobacteria bacterium]MCY4496004.1 sterol desaturase family protein [Rhodospirillaceae bacterium]
MQDWLAVHEPGIRLSTFLSVLIAMMIWEVASPRRQPSQSRDGRWTANLLMVAINTGVLRVVFPILAVGTAEVASAQNWGLLHAWALPPWISVPIAVLALDCLIYGQHVLFHSVSPLWRLHMMHHSDLDFDTTTGVRFHPIEIVISMGIKMIAVLVLGLPPEAVILFEVLLNGTSLFNHGNVRLPDGVDRVLRLFVVTPDMHRVHHSIYKAETNSNFGFNFPWWDRLFGTYRAQPATGHTEMTIGLEQFREPSRLSVYRLLLMPFIDQTGGYPIARKVQDPDPSE